MKKPLILVCEQINTILDAKNSVSNDASPQRDYMEIARKLDVDLLGYDLSRGIWYQWTRQFQTLIRMDLLEAIFAASQSSKYSVILSMSEKAGIPLAAALSLTRQQIPHVLLGHKLSSKVKNQLFGIWPLQHSFSRLVTVSRAQRDFATHHLKVPESKVEFVYDKVDHHFFHPQNSTNSDNNYILTVGREQRDFDTLVKAISGTNIKLIVLPSSPWSTSHIKAMHSHDNIVVMDRVPYPDLRDLYAGARLIVTPLFNANYAAGVNTVLEAMAMEKPVIVSRTEGIKDYITDDETGKYVSVENSQELRDTILTLWDNPAELKRLRKNARQVIDEKINLDIYVDKFVDILAY